MKYFLSLDIDFWNGTPVPYVKQYLNQIARHAKRWNINLTSVMNHQQMLPLVNKSKARHLLNIDTHSDLAPANVAQLDCGSWISYVKWRGEGIYEWVHRSPCAIGDCASAVHGLIIFRDGQASIDDVTDWRKITHRLSPGAPRPSYIVPQCADICVCMSPDYADDALQDLFTAWRIEHGIKYTKGRRDENYGRWCKPPLVRRYAPVLSMEHPYERQVA